MQFYVYEWFNVHTDEVFYVGKGCRQRYKVRKHNKKFNDYLKTHTCESRIVKTFDYEDLAFEYEFERVKELKAKGQCYCNIYDGGSGGVTTWWNDKRRNDYSMHNVMKQECQRERMSTHNPMYNSETVEKTAKQKRRAIVFDGTIYESARHLASAIDCKIGKVRAWADKGYSETGKQCYYADAIPDQNWKQKYENRRHKNTKPVVVDGIEFDSVIYAAKYLNCDPSVLVRSLKSTNLYKNHICKYANQQPSRENSSKSITEGSTTNG